MTTSEDTGLPATITTPEALHVQLRDMLAVVADILERHSLRYYLACGTALGAVRHGDLIPWDFDVDLLVPVTGYADAVRVLREDLPPRYVVKDPHVDPTYEHLFSRVHLAGVDHKHAHLDLFPLVGTFSHPRAQRAQLVASKQLRRLFYVLTRLVSTSPGSRSRVVPTAGRLAMRLVPRRLLLLLFERVGALKGPAARHQTNLVALYLEREAMPRRLFDRTARVTLHGRDYPVPSPPEEYLERLFGDYLTPPPEEERARLRAFFDSWYLPALHDVPLQVDP